MAGRAWQGRAGIGAARQARNGVPLARPGMEGPSTASQAGRGLAWLRNAGRAWRGLGGNTGCGVTGAVWLGAAMARRGNGEARRGRHGCIWTGWVAPLGNAGVEGRGDDWRGGAG